MKRNTSPVALLLAVALCVAAPVGWLHAGSSGGSSSSSGMPTRYVTGLGLEWTSSTAISVLSGKARDSADTGDITLAADTAVTITIAGTSGVAGELDQKRLSETANTDGSTATFVCSANIADDLGTRAGTGTISTSTTTLTPSNAAWFLKNVTVGDLVGSSTTYGWSRVTAIASGGATATLSAALPGGDATTIAFTVIENATVWPGSTAGDKRRVKTLSADGLTVVCEGAALTSNGDTETLAVGVEIASSWYAVWISEDGPFASTQRTTPYLAGAASVRRIGWLRNDSSGDLLPFSFDAARREMQWECALGGDDTDVLSGGVTAAWTGFVCSSAIPPTSTMGYFALHCLASNAARSGTPNFRPRGIGVSTTTRNRVLFASVSTGTTSDDEVHSWLPLDGAQGAEYMAGAAFSLSAWVIGYRDDLAR